MTPEQIDQVPAGAELDALIEEKVMGYIDPDLQNPEKAGMAVMRILHYSTEIDDAWLVVEKLKEQKYSVTIYCVGQAEQNYLPSNQHWGCQIYHQTRKSNHHCVLDPPHENSGFFVFASALSAPEAICRAALKTIGGKE